MSERRRQSPNIARSKKPGYVDCRVCRGDGALPSADEGSQWGDIWCPACNTADYLDESHAVVELEEKLEEYRKFKWLTREDVARILRESAQTDAHRRSLERTAASKAHALRFWPAREARDRSRQ